jgi:hypothetical protein
MADGLLRFTHSTENTFYREHFCGRWVTVNVYTKTVNSPSLFAVPKKFWFHFFFVDIHRYASEGTAFLCSTRKKIPKFSLLFFLYTFTGTASQCAVFLCCALDFFSFFLLFLTHLQVLVLDAPSFFAVLRIFFFSPLFVLIYRYW